MTEMPRRNVPYNYFMLPLAETYFKLEMNKEGNELLKSIADIYEEDLNYYLRFSGKLSESIDTEKQQAMAVLQRTAQVARIYKQEELAKQLDERLKKFGI